MSTTTKNGTATAAAIDVTILASDMSDALFNASLFTSDPKKARPTLEHVRLEVGPNRLCLEATDSYALIRQWVDLIDPAAQTSRRRPRKPVVVYLHRSWAIAWSKNLGQLVKARRDWAVRLTVTGLPSERVVAVGPEGDDWAALSGDAAGGEMAGEYPKLDSLWPDKGEAVEQINVGVEMLARIAKVRGAQEYASWTFHSTSKPITVALGPSIHVLQMPVRGS